jgi:hypothetical protein
MHTIERVSEAAFTDPGDMAELGERHRSVAMIADICFS